MHSFWAHGLCRDSWIRFEFRDPTVIHGIFLVLWIMSGLTDLLWIPGSCNGTRILSVFVDYVGIFANSN